MVESRPITADPQERSRQQDPESTGMRSAMIACAVLGVLAIAWTTADLRRTLDRAVIVSESPFNGRRLDPGTATLPEWTLVPGIGPAVAGRIDVARREGRGGGLDEVSGVGPITLRDAAPYLLHPSRRIEGGAFVR